MLKGWEYGLGTRVDCVYVCAHFLAPSIIPVTYYPLSSPLPLSPHQLFLSHSPRYSTGLTDSPFESKAIALVQAIQDKEVS